MGISADRVSKGSGVHECDLCAGVRAVQPERRIRTREQARRAVRPLERAMKPLISLSCALVILCHASTLLAQPRPAPPASQRVQPSYGQLVSAGYDLLKEGKPKEAYVAAMMPAS